jgi:hypothetical protein
LKQPLPEELAAGVRDEEPKGAEQDADRQVRRIGEGRRHLIRKNVTRDAASDATEHRH